MAEDAFQINGLLAAVGFGLYSFAPWSEPEEKTFNRRFAVTLALFTLMARGFEWLGLGGGLL